MNDARLTGVSILVLLALVVGVLVGVPALNAVAQEGANTATVQPVTGTVTTEALNVRTGPGAEYLAVGVVHKGDIVSVSGRNDDASWLRITKDSVTGWASARYVSVQGDASALPVTSPEPDAAKPAGTAQPAGTSSAPATAVQTGQHAYTYEGDGFHLNYLLFLARDYQEDPQRKWPLILFLHGSGERGDTLADLERLKLHGPARRVEQQPDMPFIVLSPQWPTSSPDWYPLLDPLEVLLNEIVARYRVDPAHLYLTGLSVGGEGAWLLGAKYPDQFAAIVPVAGYYSHGDIQDACKLKDVPIWVFHGALDTVVPPAKSEEMVNALKGCGGNVRFTLYPDEEHGGHMFARVYNGPELYTWMLQQSK